MQVGGANPCVGEGVKRGGGRVAGWKDLRAGRAVGCGGGECGSAQTSCSAARSRPWMAASNLARCSLQGDGGGVEASARIGGPWVGSSCGGGWRAHRDSLSRKAGTRSVTASSVSAMRNIHNAHKLVFIVFIALIALIAFIVIIAIIVIMTIMAIFFVIRIITIILISLPRKNRGGALDAEAAQAGDEDETHSDPDVMMTASSKKRKTNKKGLAILSNGVVSMRDLDLASQVPTKIRDEEAAELFKTKLTLSKAFTFFTFLLHG